MQFSAQWHYTGGGGSGNSVFIWLRKNGVNVPESATRITASSNHPYTVSAWDFMLSLNANDYLQLMWSTDNTNIVLARITESGPVPGIPSLIVTMLQV